MIDVVLTDQGRRHIQSTTTEVARPRVMMANFGRPSLWRR